MAGRSASSPPPARLGTPCHGRPPLTACSPAAAGHARCQHVRGVNRRHRPRADLAVTGHEDPQRRAPNHRAVTVDENRVASPPSGPARRSPRTSGKVPARSPALVACGQSATDTRHDRRASGYESPPGARRPARAPPGGGRWRRLPAGRGDGAGTGRAGVAAAGQQQPPSSIDLGHRRPAKPARPDDRTPGAHHRARAEVGPRHVRQPCRAEGLPPTRGRVADLLRSATRQIVASDHSGLPMVTADGSSPSSGCCRRRTRRHLHVAAPRRLRQHGPRRLGGGSSDRLRTRPAASLVRRPGDAQGNALATPMWDGQMTMFHG